MAPVILEARARGRMHVLLCTSGQHRDMLDDGLASFGLTPNIDLQVMQADQSLPALSARLLTSLTDCFSAIRPDAVLVQGDTQTCLCAAQAAFWNGIPVGHVEAGLRSNERRNPFPEEMNRRLTDALSDWHFAPTHNARLRLLSEGIRDDTLLVTGNTAIDALLLACRTLEYSQATYVGFSPSVLGHAPVVLVTEHRRENHGLHLEDLCAGLRDVVEAHPSVQIVCPVHMNPRVHTVVYRLLGGLDRIHLIPPQPYLAFVDLMRRSALIVSDSGGIQEEAPSLGRPVLVTRTNTERPEMLSTGFVTIVGCSRDTIAHHVLQSLKGPPMPRLIHNPCGDGQAARRIVDFLESTLL